MHGFPWRALALAAALLAAACAALEPAGETAAAARSAVITSVVETLRADEADQRRGLATARAEQRAQPDASSARARLGLLLALLPDPLANPSEAESLLAPLARARDDPFAEVASIGLATIAQRRRLEARARLAETHAADAERGTPRAEEQARQAEARAAEAERKLEAMKAIERRVLEREVPRDVRRR